MSTCLSCSDSLGLEIVAEIAEIAEIVVVVGPAFWCMSFQMELMELTTKDSSKVSFQMELRT